MYEPTELQCFVSCPYLWYLRYHKKIKPAARSLPLISGTLGHHLLHYGIEFVDEIWPMILRDGPPVNATAEDLETAKDKVYSECERFLKYMDICSYEFVEKELILTWTFYCGEKKPRPYYFSGTVDALVRGPKTPEGMVDVLDYKFGRKQSKYEIDRNLQFMAYFMGLKLKGYLVNEMFWVKMPDFLPYKRPPKGTDPEDLRGIGLYPIKIVEDDMPYIRESISKVLAAMSTNTYYYSSYAIGGAQCPYCDYKNICPSLSTGEELCHE